MEYGVGHPGKIIMAKLDEDEDVLTALESLTSKENIQSGLFFIIGNLKEGRLVSGAETEEIPISPLWNHFKENHEILGIGTIFQMEGQPNIHLHSALGRGEDTFMGCLRDKSRVFLISEIVIFELLGIEALREKDRNTGLSLLKISTKCKESNSS
jgi:predicted DNA-binding protein with PD1-like motif